MLDLHKNFNENWLELHFILPSIVYARCYIPDIIEEEEEEFIEGTPPDFIIPQSLIARAQSADTLQLTAPDSVMGMTNSSYINNQFYALSYVTLLIFIHSRYHRCDRGVAPAPSYNPRAFNGGVRYRYRTSYKDPASKEVGYLMPF